jgi:uncharacterized membrane protein (DUF2068 family)
MEIVTAALMSIWAWGFIRNLLWKLPEWVLYLTVIPGIAYLSLHVPADIRNPAAVAGVVMLVQTTLFKGFLPAKQSVVKRRRSNIPPPP